MSGCAEMSLLVEINRNGFFFFVFLRGSRAPRKPWASVRASKEISILPQVVKRSVQKICQRSVDNTLFSTTLWAAHLGRFYQIIDVDVEVVIKLDEIHWWFGLNLMDHHASSFGAVFFCVLYLFAHQAVHHLSWLAFSRGRIIYRNRMIMTKLNLPVWNSNCKDGMLIQGSANE